MTENPGSAGGSYDPNAAQVPPAQVPPAQVPPAQVPPAQVPPAQVPPAQYPPPAPGFPPVDPNAQQGVGTPASGPRGAFAGFDAKNLQNFDAKAVNPLDWAIIAAGLLTLIFSFTSYYTYSVKFSAFGVSQSSSASWNAWHGLFGWFGAFVAFAAAALLAVNLIAKITLPVPVRLVVLGGFALALLCALLALLIVPGNTGGASAFGIKINKGHGYGYWITLLLLLAGTGLSFVRFQQTGGELPGRSAAHS